MPKNLPSKKTRRNPHEILHLIQLESSFIPLGGVAPRFRMENIEETMENHNGKTHGGTFQPGNLGAPFRNCYLLAVVRSQKKKRFPFVCENCMSLWFFVLGYVFLGGISVDVSFRFVNNNTFRAFLLASPIENPRWRSPTLAARWCAARSPKHVVSPKPILWAAHPQAFQKCDVHPTDWHRVVAWYKWNMMTFTFGLFLHLWFVTPLMLHVTIFQSWKTKIQTVNLGGQSSMPEPIQS